jgi:hypothetical protein
VTYVLDEVKESPRGIAQIAAAVSNALLGVALIAAGLFGLVAIAVAAFDIADQTWVSLGAQITAEAYIPATALADPYNRWWRVDAFIGVTYRTALYGPVTVLDL